ncbi:hypothetical protein H6G11_17070 [Cyanobacterium aponinum FACHB-4101]|uniref:helix-turn-helix domain-containing protein n=1 Tax=Cyanobacterium aponinum TaxID=379064 RepID=UPI0016809801|nr:helix-turn-helix domain-containing protein [Cyanobacterium aponinum]MBD2395959.1 hypothetical protein [Cyanobacterium aponinum FACHB-4101]
MAQNSSKFSKVSQKIDNLISEATPEGAIESDKKSELINPEADNLSCIKYAPIPEDTLSKFYEFKGFTRIIEAIKAEGYLVSIEDEKRILDYITRYPLTEGMIPSLYLKDIISALNLKVVTPERLFKQGNLQKSSSSLVTDTFFCVCVSKNIPFLKLNEELSELTASKKFTSGDINLQIAEEIENTLVKDFGIDTFKIFQLLLCYWYENSGVIGKNVRVSVTDLMEYIARKNKVVKDPETNKSMKLTREVNHSFLAHHTKLLDRVSVYSSGITPNIKGKKAFAISQTKLIEFTEFIFFPKQENGKIDYSNLKDMYLEYRVGKWFQYFNDDKYLTQYGFTHREAFSSSGIVSALLHWLSFKLEQNQRGEFKLKTIIEQVGLKAKLEGIYSESDSNKLRDLKQDLFRVLMSALTEIREKIEDPYQWEYKNAPQWLIDNSKKPRGWFEAWLDVVIVFKHPQILIAEGKEYRREKIKEVTPEAKPNKLTANDLKSALNQYSDNKNVSLRKLAEAYGTSQPTLSRKLKSGKFTQLELKELIRLTHFLGKNKK